MRHLIISQRQLDGAKGTEFERSLGQCGVEAHTVSCDGHMTLDQVMYMLTRLRGPEDGEPSGSRICMWKTDGVVFLSIGFDTINIEMFKDPIIDLIQWIEDALEDEFE
ncbi:hypothetical protein vBPFY1MI_68 [Pseudomonas phage vB_PF_Y1-MI]|nr:hypothetical protein vBPFY1MI_68 [Pseudomonas phage vB_PF_Y1-MI]